VYRIKNSGKITLEKKALEKKVEILAGKKMKYGYLSHKIVLGFSLLSPSPTKSC